MKTLSKIRKLNNDRWKSENKAKIKAKIKAERLAEIQELRNQGLSYKEISDKVGLDRTWVSKILRNQTD